MTLPLHQVVATATRLAVLSTTHGVAHAIADAIAPLLARIVRMSTIKTLVPALVILLLVAARPALSRPLIVADDDTLFVAGGLTAGEVAARARASSPAVWRKLAELDAAAADVTAATDQRIPRLSLSLSYTRLSRTEPRDAYAAEAQVVVPVSDHFLRFPTAIRAARLAKQATALDTRATQADVANRALHAYYEWARARLRLQVAARELAQVHAAVVQMRSLVAVQRLARAELMRIEAQEAETEQAHARLRDLVMLREQALRLQIGAGPDETLTLGEDLRAELSAPAFDQASRRADVRAVAAAVEATEQRAALARASALPQLSAFATGDYARPNVAALPPEDRFSPSWSAGVQLTWSLPELLASRTSSRRLAAEARALRADRTALEREAQLELVSARQGVELAQLALVTSRKGLIAAEETYRVRSALIAAERATAVELVDAQTTLTRARIAVLDAHIDLRIAIADLGHALGTDTLR